MFRFQIGKSMAGLLRYRPSLSQLSMAGWIMIYAGAALADSSGAPWDGPLCGIAGWFKGTTAVAVGTIAFGAAALGFVWGEEATGIMKKLVNITMAVCVLLGAGSFLGWIAAKLGAGTAMGCT